MSVTGTPFGVTGHFGPMVGSGGFRRFLSATLPLIATLAFLDYEYVLEPERTQPTPSPLQAMPGRWTFPKVTRKRTTHPIFLTFQRGWERPDGTPIKLESDAWKLRITALCSLARLGADAIPILLDGLNDEDDQIRILSAQALGYLGDDSVAVPLERAIRQDPDVTVRIYAAIARGSLPGGLSPALAAEVKKKDPHPMPRILMELTELRKEPRSPSLGEDLAHFDPATMDSARVGDMAPDFHLTDLNGHAYRLSDFRGKKKVVLVFLYGSTCMYCSAHLMQFHGNLHKFEEADTQVLVVESNDPHRARETILAGDTSPEKIRFPILCDPSHLVAALYGVAMQMEHLEWLNRPATFVIDREGKIRHAHLATRPGDRPSYKTLLDQLNAIEERSSSL